MKTTDEMRSGPELAENRIREIIADFIHDIKPGKYLAAAKREHDTAITEDKEIQCDNESNESNELPTCLGFGELWIDGEIVPVHDWLGSQRTAMIHELHTPVQPHPPRPDEARERFKWQKTAVSKILTAWKSPVRGVIDMDEMGLGKTLSAVDACLHDTQGDTKPGFSLVVTTRSCVPQWVEETQAAFQKGQRPRVFVLKDTRVMATDLLTGDFDFVITTYDFIFHQHRSLEQYQNFWKLSEEAGMDNAVLEYRRQGLSFSRPVLSLFSSIYRDLNIPIKHLVLDEVQVVKKFNGRKHQAIKALYYEKVLMLSGTPFGNRWTDISGVIDLLPIEPLDSHETFMRIFGGGSSGATEPPPSFEAKLLKYLMSLSFGRPSTLLSLPNCTRKDFTFQLSRKASAAVVAHVDKFYNSLRYANRHYSPMGHAIRAQQMAANRVLYSSSQIPQDEGAHGEHIMQRFRQDAQSNAHKPSEQRPSWVRVGLDDDDPSGFFDSFIEWQQETKGFHGLIEDNFEGEEDAGSEDEEPGDNDYKDDDNDDDDDDDDDDDNDDNDGDNSDTREGLVDPEEILDNRKLEDEAWCKQVKSLKDEDLFSDRVEAFIRLFEHINTAFPGEKTVVWSRFLRFLDILEEALSRRKSLHALRFDGRLSDDNRTRVLEQFAQSSNQCPLLITPGSGGAGLNITAGSKVIFTEPWWNKQDVLQAEKRCIRPGQMKNVHIFNLFAENSAIDVVIKRGATAKLGIINKFMAKLRRPDDEPPQIPYITKEYSWVYF